MENYNLHPLLLAAVDQMDQLSVKLKPMSLC